MLMTTSYPGKPGMRRGRTDYSCRIIELDSYLVWVDALSSESGENSSSSLLSMFLAFTKAALIHISWGSNHSLCLRMKWFWLCIYKGRNCPRTLFTNINSGMFVLWGRVCWFDFLVSFAFPVSIRCFEHNFSIARGTKRSQLAVFLRDRLQFLKIQAFITRT